MEEVCKLAIALQNAKKVPDTRKDYIFSFCDALTRYQRFTSHSFISTGIHGKVSMKATGFSCCGKDSDNKILDVIDQCVSYLSAQFASVELWSKQRLSNQKIINIGLRLNENYYKDSSNFQVILKKIYDGILYGEKLKKLEHMTQVQQFKIYRHPCNNAWISEKVGVGLSFFGMIFLSGVSFFLWGLNFSSNAGFKESQENANDPNEGERLDRAATDHDLTKEEKALKFDFGEFQESSLKYFLYFEEETINVKYSSPPQPGTGNMQQQLSRLVSFQNFPETIPANPNMLSRTGFFYTGHGDSVQCFFCSNVVSAIHSSVPFHLSMHRFECRFAQEKGGCGNIPLDQIDARPAVPDAYLRTSKQPTAGNILMQPRGMVQSAQTSTASHSNRRIPLERPMANVLSSAHSRFLERLNLLVEVDRLKSFSSWPSMPPRPTARSMARAGFFYLGNLDRTQCFSCGGVLRNWRGNDDPLTEHRRHFSHCKMARGLETLNVKDDTPLPPQVSTSSHERFSLSSEERRNLQLMFPCEQPVTPDMKALHLRVETFKHWTFTNATDYSIAVAGFFSLNVRDRVKCFHCNGGLQNWQRNDDPWEEHAKWYPTCEFLLQMKGPDYVHSVVARFPDLNRPILQSPGNDVPPPTQNQRMASTSGGFSAPEIIDPQREVLKLLDDAMKSEVTEIVVGMGFEEKIVRAVMKSHIQEHGKPYETATALLDAVMNYDEEAMDTEESTKLPTAQTQTRRLQDEFTELPAMLSYQAAPSSSTSASATLLASSGSDGDARMKSSESLEMKPSRCAEIKPIESVEKMESEEIIEDEGELEKRLEQLIDERVCKVCLDKPADVVFIPCGHICCCLSCTQALRKCPICREKIEKGVRTCTS